MTESIKEVKLIAKRDDIYTVYVFQDIYTKEYIMCTRLPDWQTPEVDIGSVGYLKYVDVMAGEQYVTSSLETFYYRFTNCYFIDFLHKIDNDEHVKIII